MAHATGNCGHLVCRGGVLPLSRWSLGRGVAGRPSVSLDGRSRGTPPSAGEHACVWLENGVGGYDWSLVFLWDVGVYADTDGGEPVRFHADADATRLLLGRRRNPDELSMEWEAVRTGVWGPYADYLMEYGDENLGLYLAQTMCASAHTGGNDAGTTVPAS